MCFNKTKATTFFPRKAKEDILVYKIMFCGEYEAISSALYFPYVYRKIYKKSFFFFRTLFRKAILTHQGFHSFLNLDVASNLKNKWHDSESVVVCYIPKGALFFENPRNNTVISNKIVICGKHNVA